MKIRKIAFQGELGAYSELAAFEHFGTEIITLPCESFDGVYEAILTGEAYAWDATF